MSQVVTGVFDAVGSVVNGVVKAVKDVASSGIGKAVIGAAAIYFGGAFISGAMGSAAGSGIGGAISGGISGMSAAGSSLMSAGTSLLAGEFSAAGSAIASGFGGEVAGAGLATAGGGAAGAAADFGAQTYAAGEAVAGGASTAATQTGGLINAGYAAPTELANILATPAAAPAAPAGLIGKMMSNPLVQMQGVKMAGDLAGGYFKGAAAEEAERAKEEKLRAAYTIPGLIKGYATQVPNTYAQRNGNAG